MSKDEKTICDVNLALLLARLQNALDLEEYKDLFAYNLPEDEEYTEEDEELQDALDFVKDTFNAETRQIFFDHLNDDPNAPITGVTVLDGLGNVLIDKDFDTPIPMDTEGEQYE